MPSNLILMKVGAPLWLSIIIVSWGVTATAFAGLNGTTSFYVLRLLLGCTEAGTFPGVEHQKVLPAWCMLRAGGKEKLSLGCAEAATRPAGFEIPASMEPCSDMLLLRADDYRLEQEWTRQDVPLVCALLVCWYMFSAHSAPSMPSFNSNCLPAFRYMVRHVQLLLRWAVVLHRREHASMPHLHF